MHPIQRAIRSAGAAAVVIALTACGGPSGTAPSLGPAGESQVLPQMMHGIRHHATTGKIKHVVIIVQENRSFNNLFYGFPGATTATYGYDTHGNKITLQPVGLETTWDIEHDAQGFLSACNGTGSFPGTDCQMNGFDNEYWGCGHYGSKCPNSNPPYSYVPNSETQPYFAMAKQYVLADQMFASNYDASSFISHQYIIAGQAMSAVNFPDGSWGCEGGPSDVVPMVTQKRTISGSEQACFTDDTLGSELDNAGLPWAFYTSEVNGRDVGQIWSAYQANEAVYSGPDWSKDVIWPQTNIFSDITGGKLRAVSWVTPTWTNSDHAGSGSKTGPSWVTSLVNAIGKSKYWNSTAIFIFWDDYGGWFDPVAPALVDYDGLGMRIPMIIVSPYAKKGYISETPYEHGSILKFAEDQFGLPRLSASDTRANSPTDAFDFSKPPRKFHTIKAQYDKAYFLHQAPDYHAPDDN